LVVYEPEVKEMKKVLVKFNIDYDYDSNSLESSISRAERLRTELAVIKPQESILSRKLINEPYVLESKIPHRETVDR
jgi:hypothetical protein